MDAKIHSKIKGKVLFIIPCSNHKEELGDIRYNPKNSIAYSLSRETAAYLLELRELALAHIKDGSFSRSGKRLVDLPYNKSIIAGRDFGKKEAGKYLMSRKRYIGRLYREIPENVWERRLSHVLIISGLYGMVLPEEDIQLYSLDNKDSLIISEIWKNEIPKILLEYIKTLAVEYVVDLTAERSYRNFIQWDVIKENYFVVHGFGEQNAGPALLESFGDFLAKIGLITDDENLVNLFRNVGRYKTRYEEIFFLRNLNDVKKLSLPEEGIDDFEKKREELIPHHQQPEEFKDLFSVERKGVNFTFKSLQEYAELPKEVRAKVPKAILNYIRNPGHPRLKVKKVSKLGPNVYRFRIDPKYRIHLEKKGEKKSSLIIRAIGGHRLEGIGD